MKARTALTFGAPAVLLLACVTVTPSLALYPPPVGAGGGEQGWANDGKYAAGGIYTRPSKMMMEAAFAADPELEALCSVTEGVCSVEDPDSATDAEAAACAAVKDVKTKCEETDGCSYNVAEAMCNPTSPGGDDDLCHAIMVGPLNNGEAVIAGKAACDAAGPCKYTLTAEHVANKQMIYDKLRNLHCTWDSPDGIVGDSATLDSIVAAFRDYWGDQVGN
jgi:hypothetical protein